MFFIIAMIPTSNFIPINWPVADRYLYFPMFGIVLALSGLLCKLKIKIDFLRISAIIGICIIALNLLCFTIERELVWHRNLSLWQDTVNKNPYSFTGSYNLGFALYNNGNYQDALIAFTKASEIKPFKPSVKAAMAMTCDVLGQTKKADEYFVQAVSLDNQEGNSEKLINSFLWTYSQIERVQKIAERVSKEKKTE
jgi:tetratricopeptide (TPR) repeat protein